MVRKLTAQVADVNQPLLAVRGMTKTGHRVVFDDEGDEGSYILHKASGEYMPMRFDGKMYVLKLWACREGDQHKGF